MRKIWLSLMSALALTAFVAMPASAAANCPQPQYQVFQWKSGCQQPAPDRAAGSQASCPTPNGATAKVVKLDGGNLRNLDLNNLLASICGR